MNNITTHGQNDGLSADLLSEQTIPAITGDVLEIGPTKVRNLSGLPTGRLLNMLPTSIAIDEVVFFPDVSPGKGAIPTGTVVKTRDPNWHKLAVSDCGCGMQLIRSDITFSEFEQKKHLWDKLGRLLQRNKGDLGDLGGGNHFLDAIAPYDDSQSMHFLIHTGSRLESGLVDHLVGNPSEFKQEFGRVVNWARSNRDTVADTIRSLYGNCELIVDLPHNTYEQQADGAVVVRKGAVKAQAGSLIVLPSHMTGDVSLLRATPETVHTLESLCHGTGRAMSRSEAREHSVDYEAIRRSVYIPEYINNSSLRTEGPHCYRSLSHCQEMLKGLIKDEARFAVVAYLGHL